MPCADIVYRWDQGKKSPGDIPEILTQGDDLVRFRLVSRDSVEVILCQEEIFRLGFDRDEIDCTDPQTQTLLIEILQKARKETGGLKEQGDFLVEIHQEDEDTVLSFTLEGQSDALEEQGLEVFCFGGSEEMIQCGLRLYQSFQEQITKSSLYALAGNYYMILIAPGKGRTAVRGLALEYASLADRKILAKGALEEHGVCLFQENALSKITRYFG